MTTTDITRDEALRALGAWAEENYTGLMQAMLTAAERNRSSARDETMPAGYRKVSEESAQAWELMRAGLRAAFLAVPAEPGCEHGNDPDTCTSCDALAILREVHG